METTTSDEWKRYGRTVIRSMRELLTEVDEQTHSLLLETADYWLSVGLSIGLRDPAAAGRLAAVIESVEAERLKLDEDALAFCGEALE